MKNIISLSLFIGSLAFAEGARTRYDVALERMQAMVSSHPQYASLFSIGTNDDNVEIMGIRISTQPGQVDPSKVGHLIVGTHHGNELKAAEFVLRYAEALLSRYESGELWRGDLADLEWSIVPVLNISGYNVGQRYEHGVDPNRDYPNPCNTHSVGKLKSIKQIQNFMKTRIFTGTITVHGYIGTLTYPWGMEVADTHTLDHNEYEKIVSKAASFNHYRYGTSTDIVYSAEATYEDFVYLEHGMWSLLLELQSGSDSDISNTILAINSFFDQLDSSPSSKHSLNTQCTKSILDLRVE